MRNRNWIWYVAMISLLLVSLGLGWFTMKAYMAIKKAFVLGAMLDGMRPEPKVTVTEWARRHRKLDTKGSAEAGPYNPDRTPYLIPLMDWLSMHSGIEEIIVMKGVQLGFTEAGFNLIGYCMHMVPCPIMYVMPTVETMERNVKQRINPMIENCPELAKRIGGSGRNNGGNTLRQKEGPGFVLILTGANSAAGLRSVAARVVVFDEMDGYPADVDGEGSPVFLAENRMVTFGRKKKKLKISTPTIEGQSPIEAEFNNTDQCYWYLPCPECNYRQRLDFEQLKWERGNYDDVYYQCVNCEFHIKNHHKTYMLAHGKWEATVPEKKSKYKIGVNINSLYSPDGWLSWEDVAKMWDEAENDEPKKKAFINTILAKTYKIKGDAPPWQMLYERAQRDENERNKVWDSVAFITAGVDVQADRLEINIVGWMKGRISQQIDYRVIEGNTKEDAVWAQLGKILDETWTSDTVKPSGRTERRTWQIRIMCVDTGYNTAKVHEFVQKHGTGRVIPIKGMDGLAMPFAAPKVVTKTKGGKAINKVKVWGVGVSYLKELYYGWLRLPITEDGEVPPGYCHFLPHEGHWFRGVTAEELVPVRNRRTNGIQYQWIKRYERNEPLDTGIYALAGGFILGFERWNAERWKREVDGNVKAVTEPKEEPPSGAKSEATEQQEVKKKRKKGFGGLW